MLTSWYFLACCVVISTVTAIHLDALPEHEVLRSLGKYRHSAKHGHSSHGRHPSHRSHSSKGRHSSHGRHYPRELETLFGEDKKEEKAVCQTEECKLIAKIIKDNINKSVDPCDNFYDYACGRFGENNPIPEGEDSWSFVQMTQRNLEKQMEGILEGEASDDDLLTIRLGKKYYRTCMDHKSRERKGLEPLVSTMARIGGWPIIMEDEEWEEGEYSWQRVDDYYAILTGFSTFYELSGYYSLSKNQTVAAIFLPRVPTGARRLEVPSDEESKEECVCDKDSKSGGEDDSKGDDEDNKGSKGDDEDDKGSKDDKEDESNEKGEDKSINDDDDESKQDSQEPGSEDEDSAELDDSSENRNMTEDYINIVMEVTMAIAEARGFKISEHRMAADVNEMILFQQRLIKLIWNNLRSSDDKTMTLREFQELYDNASFTTENAKINFAGNILTMLEYASVDADDTLLVDVQSPDFYIALGHLLDETPPRVIINYIHWLFISHFMDGTTEKMASLHKTLKTNEPPKNTTTTKKDRMEKCLNEVGLIDIMSYAFVKKYFPKEIEDTAETMISYVQKEVEREISESEWMDDTIRDFATDKVRSMKRAVGYPAWYSNMTIMKSYYKGLMISPSYYENRLSFSRYSQVKSLRVLRDKSPKDEEDMDYGVIPLMLNALYSPFENLMIVTAADFQTPFFALSRPAIINYGIIGAIMGHEVNHGFDDDGRTFTKNGKRMKWMDAMAAAYAERVECFVDQYNNLLTDKILKKSTKNRPSYGNITRNENIADTMGLEASFGAYHIHAKEKKGKPEEVLPGLEHLTTEQLFFMSYANTFCEVITPKRLKRYRMDPHSTGRLRVLGPISNSESFAKSFNCPVGSPMNPERKCNIWK